MRRPILCTKKYNRKTKTTEYRGYYDNGYIQKGELKGEHCTIFWKIEKKPENVITAQELMNVPAFYCLHEIEPEAYGLEAKEISLQQFEEIAAKTPEYVNAYADTIVDFFIKLCDFAKNHNNIDKGNYVGFRYGGYDPYPNDLPLLNFAPLDFWPVTIIKIVSKKLNHIFKCDYFKPELKQIGRKIYYVLNFANEYYTDETGGASLYMCSWPLLSFKNLDRREILLKSLQIIKDFDNIIENWENPAGAARGDFFSHQKPKL